MRAILKFNTRVGTFFIAQSSNGRYHPFFNNESLGSYSSIVHAVDDLINGATFSVLHPSTAEVLDTSTLGLPEDPRDWERA